MASLVNAGSASAGEVSLGEAQTSSPPERISVLVTFGDDKCPVADGEEIVVCAAQPEGERYRIPKPLREKKEAVVTSTSWTSAVESLDAMARSALPNGCSVNGSYGFTGCNQLALQKWFAERRGKLDAR